MKIIIKTIFVFIVMCSASLFASDTQQQRRTFSAGIAFKDITLSDSLQALQNASFWGTFYLSEQSAIRIAGQFNFKDDDDYSLFGLYNKHDYIVLLSCEFVRSIKFRDNVTFFGAVGPAISITNQIGQDLEFYEVYALGSGATGSVGIEYTLLGNLAFVGEYTTSFLYVKRKYDGVDYYIAAPVVDIERSTALYSFFRAGFIFNF